MPESLVTSLGLIGPNTIDCHVGGRVRAARILAGLSASALAARLGVAEQTLLRYEIGQERIRAAQLFALAAAFDVPLRTFFDEAR